jgi:hypothetical protein
LIAHAAKLKSSCWYLLIGCSNGFQVL